MPLRAFINNKEVISVDLSSEEWTILKKEIKEENQKVVLPCCNQSGYLRTSAQGLNHFVHKSGENKCDHKGESRQHLKAKVEIIKACRANGWKAIPEYSENDWRADVMAIKGDKRIAFEVQWSPQTLEETLHRQSKFERDNVRGCWFFKKPPKKINPNKELPYFKIEEFKTGEIRVCDFMVSSLFSFTEDLLKGKMRYCDHLSARRRTELEITFFETSCWRCGKNQHQYFVEENVDSCCGHDIYIPYSLWGSKGLDKHPNVLHAIENLLKTKEGKEIKFGKVKKRYSKTTKSSYLSFGCKFCDALFGDFLLADEKNDARYQSGNIPFKMSVALPDIKMRYPHWCYAEDGLFCE